MSNETTQSAQPQPMQSEADIVSPEIAVLLYNRNKLNFRQARHLSKMSISQFSTLLANRDSRI